MMDFNDREDPSQNWGTRAPYSIELQTLINSMLSEDPEERPSTCEIALNKWWT
jgi:hypothetical protein